MHRSHRTTLLVVLLAGAVAKAESPPPAPPNIAPDHSAAVPCEPAAGDPAGERAWVNVEYLLWWMR
jgi:hypothetical protein